MLMRSVHFRNKQTATNRAVIMWHVTTAFHIRAEEHAEMRGREKNVWVDTHAFMNKFHHLPARCEEWQKVCPKAHT